MFTYINENFLHAPSTDLSRDTVKTLINIMLAQGQEVFLEKQVADNKKHGLLAKLASQAHFLYSQAQEGVQENFAKGVFDITWTKVAGIKAAHMASVSEYYQALTEVESGAHGSAIARLQLAEKSSKTAYNLAKGFPSSVSASSNLSSDTGPNLQTITKRHLENVQEKLTSLVKDNDFIYHQTVPAEASLSAIAKFPAAKAIPVSELYQGQDIQRIIGTDIFQKIVPMSVTESASMYDEEKAKLVRSEAEKADTANGEMAASLDYLKLPNSLNVLKGGLEQEMTMDNEFAHWCAELAGHEPFSHAFDQLQKDKADVLESLASSSKQLDMEESVCEKMRSKYGGDWTQQPSSRLTSTLRSDIKSYRNTVDEASTSDAQLMGTARQYELDFEEMRAAGDSDEADLLFQRAMIKAGAGRSKGKNGTGSPEGNLLDEDYGESGPTIADQIARVEELLKKLNLVKRERMQVLKDLKEKVWRPSRVQIPINSLQVHNDDISNVLILNKKQIANHENQLFQAELEKFRSHQNRLVSTVHKQSSLLKELTKTYGDLLQDKRVRADQQKYEAMQRSKNSVTTRYRRVFSAHQDLIQGLMRAQGFYSEMKESVDSLEKNVETFVNNRRAEGAQLLNQIEHNRSNASSGQATAERERMQQLMERMSMEPSPSSPNPSSSRPPPIPAQPSHNASPVSPQYATTNADPRFTIPPRRSPRPPSQVLQPTSSHPTSGPDGQQYPPHQPPTLNTLNSHPFSQGAAAPLSSGYNPMAYPYQAHLSPPVSQGTLPPQHQQQQQQQQQHQQHYFSPVNQSPNSPSYPLPQTQMQPPPQQLSFTSPSPQPTQPPWQYAQPYGLPSGYVPPPPPPGPPGGGSQTQYPPSTGAAYASGPGGYAQSGQRPGQPQQPQQQQAGGPGPDPWAGLSAWR